MFGLVCDMRFVPELPRSTDTRPEVAPATRKDVAMPAPHPPEFRRRAVEVARQGDKPIAALAKDLRISSRACGTG
jgi:transposase-like protein